MKFNFLSKGGAVLALAALLFMPLIRCAGDDMNGREILFDFEKNSTDVSVLSIKLFLGIAIVLALLALIFKQQTTLLFTSIGGLISLVITYIIAREKWEIPFDALKIGTYSAILGFLAIFIGSFMGKDETKNK